LCNHAGLGLGRHAMNLKELHLGPRPRAAALTRRATSWFRRVGNVPEAAVKMFRVLPPASPPPFVVSVVRSSYFSHFSSLVSVMYRTCTYILHVS
jgi:hypothetical protein